MVLVDTSVWIRFFLNRAPHAQGLDILLALDQAAAHEMVYGELLISDRGGRREFLENYQQMHQARTVPHEEVVEFVRHRKLHGRGMGWIDVHLLASAIVGRMELWTADEGLARMAEELGVGYREPYVPE